jgi:hypothetical protein
MLTHVAQRAIDDCEDLVVKLDNPLKVAFPSPKSERNLVSSTVFREVSSQPDVQLDRDEKREVSAQPAYAFSITQILG